MDMSNKSLALLLVAAIVISLGTSVLILSRMTDRGITGRALTGSGQVNLSVTTNSSCTVDCNVDFGSDAPSTTVEISTDVDNSAGSNFSDCSSDGACSGIVVNNTGNTVINITFNSTENGTAFIGGNESHFQYYVDQTETDSDGCVTPGSVTWTAVPLANTRLCGNLSYTPGNDTVTLEFNVTINESTTSGVASATINMYCETA